jgi:regulator of replication initiation timing
MPRHLNTRSLIAMLDELRSACELARDDGAGELSRQLLSVRRCVLSLVHQHLALQSETARLREVLTRHEARVRAARHAAEEALFTTRREDRGPRKPS